MAVQDYLKVGGSAESLYASVSERLRNSPRVKAARENAEYIRQHRPDLRTRILDRARSALRGTHVLPGTGGEPYFVGAPPQWNVDPVGDNEYVWGLNRMGWWSSLVWAWTIEGDPAFARHAVDEFYDWVQRNPRPDLTPAEFNGVTPWRALEVGLRMIDPWPLLPEHVLDSTFWSVEFVSTYVESVAEHAEVLHRICPRYWPDADHNHYLTETLGLFSVACRFPELANAESWRTQAMSELERCARNQLTEDGGQVEGCPGYHNHCVERFCHSIVLAREHGCSFSQEYVQRVRRGVHHSLHSVRPTGTIVPWGDSDANRSYLPPAVYGLLLFDDVPAMATACAVSEPGDVDEAVFASLNDVPDLRALLSRIDSVRTAEARLPTRSWQHQLKQAMVRTDWTRDALSLFFACQSPVHHGGHAHMDPMGFDFCAYGEALLVDPGRFTYREGAERVEFKSATAHNTVTVDNREPFEYLSKFDYGPQKWGDIVDMYERDGVVAVVARQETYAPTMHYRSVLLADRRFLVIVDRFEATGDSRPAGAQLYFHLDSTDVELTSAVGSATGSVAGGAVHSVLSRGSRVRLHLSVLPTRGVERSAASLLPGRVSQRIDEAHGSTRLRVDCAFAAARSAERCVPDPHDATGCSAEVVSVAVPVVSDTAGGEMPVPAVTAHPEGGGAAVRVDGRQWRLSYADKSFSLERE